MQTENPLLVQPIPKLIRQIGVPVATGVLFNSLYQIVDTFYAGTISKEAIAALALSFPIYFIIIGVAAGLATGTSALIGNSLGAGKQEEACHIAGQGLVLTSILSVVVALVGLAASPTLFGILGASGDELDMNMSYITPIFQGTIFYNLVFMFNGALSSQGNTRPFRNFLFFGFVVNIVLDPWFINGGLGVKPMGIAGVGVATVLVEAIGAVYLGITAYRTQLFSIFRWDMLLPRLSLIRQIVWQGLPPALDLSTVSVGGFVLTYFVSRFGTDAVAAYGIGFRIDGLIWIPLFGLDIATLTLVSQSNGAQRFDRMWSAFYTATRYGLLLMVFSGVLVFIFARPLVGIFTDDPNIIEMGTVYIRISAVALPSRPLGFIGFAALRGIKRPLLPMFMSMARMIVLPAICLYIFIDLLGGGLLTIWWTVVFITTGTGLAALYAVIKLMPRPEAAPQPTA